MAAPIHGGRAAAVRCPHDATMFKEHCVELDPLARIAQWVAAQPDATAVDAGDVRITYSALDRRAAAMARALSAAGCAAASLAAVLVADRATLVSVMLGVLRAGAVFVPLEGDAPDERIRQRLARLRPRFLIHDTDAGAAARQHADVAGAGCICVAVPGDDAAATGNCADRAHPSTAAPAYIYFTSGSTGQPKGIVGSLPALASRIAWEIETFRVRAGTRVSQLVTPTFDPWFRDVLVPLCAGGTICVPPEHPSRLEPERLLEWLRDERIELMHCGPALMNALVSTPARIRRLPALRTVLSSGETLHVSLVRRWRRRFGRQMELVNLYGPTEATMAQFCHRIEAVDAERAFIPVGRPLPGVKVRLVDKAGAACAPGEVGEILIGGAALSLGYHDDGAATARSFVRAGSDGDEIHYRSGDLGVEFQAGCYRLLGRIDDQVKIRGVRVEPREVEDALLGYPLIATCAVAARPDATGEPSLVAYVVPETEYPPAVPEMRAYLRERLPPQSIPATFVVLKALPLSANGKVDRARLPDPAAAPAPQAIVAAPPRNALEAALAGHWAAILGLPAVGVHDDFLDLGGHSLSAMRLVGALSDSGLGELALIDILDHPTIAAQAALLQARASGGQAGSDATDGVRSVAAVSQHRAEGGFECPRHTSPQFGRRPCNLVMVLGRADDRDSYERVARLVGEFDPAIRTFVVVDAAGWETDLPPRPTLVFSPALLRHRPATPARICCGYPLAKSDEYRILERAGIPVPRWITLEQGETPDLSAFGNYVVRKPDYGAKGAEIRIVRRDRMRWKPVVTSAAGPSPRLLVQEFVYTGPWPVSYRVNTVFGRVVYCLAIKGNASRPPLAGPDDFAARGAGGETASIVANARDSSAQFCMDADIIGLGERAARAFPEMPMLGVDILKDALTARLFVTEVNSLGHNWNFTPEFAAAFRVDIEQQFDGLRKTAYVLAEETQRQAGPAVTAAATGDATAPSAAPFARGRGVPLRP